MLNTFKLKTKYKENEYASFSEAMNSGILKERSEELKKVNDSIRDREVQGFAYQTNCLVLQLRDEKLLKFSLTNYGVACSLLDNGSFPNRKLSKLASRLQIEFPDGRQYIWHWTSLLESLVGKSIGQINAGEIGLWLYIKGFTILSFHGYHIYGENAELLFFDVDEDEIQAAETIRRKMEHSEKKNS